jgi:two-component system alkaline phosphatase synthesis response regulator PhoP
VIVERKKTVLVVEDDESLAFGLEENLKSAGYEVLKARDGVKGLSVGMERHPDLIILDLMLPGMSGYEVCRNLRGKGVRVPIIMLTARQDEFDKILGFDVGADDYVTKPFSIKELLARIKAVFRREEERKEKTTRYRFDSFVLDPQARTLTQRGREIQLTRTEFDLLVYFLDNAGTALSREVLLKDVWGVEYMGTQRSLDSFVAMLRGKIERNPKKPGHIVTVHGVGYKFVGKVEKA